MHCQKNIKSTHNVYTKTFLVLINMCVWRLHEILRLSYMFQAVDINTRTPLRHSKTNIHLLSFQLLLMIQIETNVSFI